MGSDRSSCLCLLLAVLQVLGGILRADPETLTSVAPIRSLSREEAPRSVPVRLRGVVKWQDAGATPAFFIHDGEWNIWVSRSLAIDRMIWQGGNPPASDSEVGALIELEGITDPGGYAP